MEDKENQARPLRSPSRKRPAESGPENQMVKKRSVFGELTTNVSVASDLSHSSILSSSRKFKSDHVPKTADSEVNRELVVRAGSDVTQKKNRCAPTIYRHLHFMEVEVKRRPLFNYMEKVQTDVTPVMRLILVDWLVEVAEEYKLVSDTLFLAVNYIDRYLSTQKLTRNKLQLLGISCMLIASKHEEITPPHIEDFCYIADNTYKKEEVLQMERDILKFLNFETGVPTIKTFTRIFSRAAQEKPMFSELKFELLCAYVAELSLLDYGCLQYLPSMVAASAIFLARLIIQPTCHPWTRALQHQTGYKPNQMKECIVRLHNLQLQKEKFGQAVYKKYMENKFKCVASLNPPSKIPSCLFEVAME